MAARTALPAMVEITTEELVDVAAELLVRDELFRQFNDHQDAGEDAISESLGKLAYRLLAMVTPNPDPRFTEPGDVDFAHPAAVEAFARALEKRAEVFSPFQVDEAEMAAEAAAIRQSGDAFATGEEA